MNKKNYKNAEALEKENEEDRKIINNRNAPPDEIREVEERVAQCENNIRQITAQLDENMPVREKSKRFLKKWCHSDCYSSCCQPQ